MAVAAFGRYVLPLLIPILVAVGSAAVTTSIAMARLEERMTNLERSFSERLQDTIELRARNTEYERRISRVESLAEATQRRLDEIGSDVKTLLKMERGKQ